MYLKDFDGIYVDEVRTHSVLFFASPVKHGQHLGIMTLLSLSVWLWSSSALSNF